MAAEALNPREQLLAEWWSLRQKIDRNKEEMAPTCARELELRRFLMQDVWGNDLKEGTNHWDAGGGFDLKGQYKLNRTVIEETLGPVKEELIRRNINPEKIFKYTPELKLKEYRELNDEDRKVVDYCLDIKPAAPTLELIPPKAK